MQIAKRAQDDLALAQTMLEREDVPSDAFEQLLRQATKVVGQRLLEKARPEMRSRIACTLAAIAAEAAEKAARRQARPDGHCAVPLTDADVPRLKALLADYARTGKRAQTVEMLAILSRLPEQAVKGLVARRDEAEDGVLILCKAIGLGWPHVKPVLAVMTPKKRQAIEFKRAFEKYLSLSVESANRALRFVRSCKAVSKLDLQRMLRSNPAG